jgi:hypothetical protein
LGGILSLNNETLAEMCFLQHITDLISSILTLSKKGGLLFFYKRRMMQKRILRRRGA